MKNIVPFLFSESSAGAGNLKDASQRDCLVNRARRRASERPSGRDGRLIPSRIGWLRGGPAVGDSLARASYARISARFRWKRSEGDGYVARRNILSTWMVQTSSRSLSTIHCSRSLTEICSCRKICAQNQSFASTKAARRGTARRATIGRAAEVIGRSFRRSSRPRIRTPLPVSRAREARSGTPEELQLPEAPRPAGWEILFASAHMHRP